MKEIYSNKVKAHTRYKLSDGTPIPGVTTVIRDSLGWNKQFLIKWANNLGLQGIDSEKYKDEKGNIGTLAHQMIIDYLNGKKTNTDEYSKEIIDRAENSLLSFFAWEKSNKLEPILLETPLVSEQWQYGGTLDIYTKNNGVLELIDFKTGVGIYDEHLIQIAALKELLQEHGYQVEKGRILNIPRAENELFMERVILDATIYFKVFLNCLSLYNLKKEIREGKK